MSKHALMELFWAEQADIVLMCPELFSVAKGNEDESGQDASIR